MEWFWYFLFYSFLGFLLEVGYAWWTGGDLDRKCLLLLPLCPVYGLGACAVLLLPGAVLRSPVLLVIVGGLTATAVEYGVHLLYDRLLGVRFWDYSRLPGNFQGRVCLPFSLAWGLLTGAALPPVQRALGPVLAAIPPAVTYAVLLVFTADAVVSLRLLRRAGDPGILSLRALGRA